MTTRDNQDTGLDSVCWDPMSNKGANFKTSTLKFSPNYIELVPSMEMHLFTMVFAFFVIQIFSFMLTNFFNLDWIKIQNPAIAIVLVAGILFCFSRVLHSVFSRKLSFDLRRRVFCDDGKQYNFDSIYALQILKKTLDNSEGGEYLCYELNMIQADGSRLHLLSHTRLHEIQKIAKTIERSVGSLTILERSQ